MARQPKLADAVEANYVASTDMRNYAETYPTTPERMRGIVDWLDANLKTAGFVFMLRRIDEATDQAQTGWTQRFALTPAEIRLAAHLVNGGAVATYAKRHAISRNTARNQLQAVYGKTNTHRQAELVALLLKA